MRYFDFYIQDVSYLIRESHLCMKFFSFESFCLVGRVVGSDIYIYIFRCVVVREESRRSVCCLFFVRYY